MINIEKSIKLKKELDSLRPLKRDDELRIMHKFRLDWNYHSNNIEGNSLTYGETKALILFGVTAQGKPLKDHFEVTGHDDAVKWIIEVVKQDRPLTENFIRELHKLILKESYEVNAITPDGRPTKKRVNVGAYKTQSIEFDWGQVKLTIDGACYTMMLAVFVSNYSGYRWACLFHKQDMASFCESHTRFLTTSGQFPMK